MSLSANIRRLRKDKGWSQDKLAEKLGYRSFTTIQKWESEKSEPPLKKLKELADLFNIDIDQLAGTDLTDSKSLPNSENGINLGKYRIPIVATVAAGEPIYSEENIEGWIDYDKDPRGHIFACRIKGDSMSPRIQDGDIIIVDEESDWEDGDIILATVNGNDGTCKRIRKYADSIALLSLNPAYDPMIFSAEQVQTLPVEIKGKVVQFRADL